MSLFKLDLESGFNLHSGQISNWIIDCNALTDDDLQCLAHLGRALVGPFGFCVGIPKGGLRLAMALARYSTIGPCLVVDDVFTTGQSMEEYNTGEEKGLVIFARATTPEWITPIFKVSGNVS